MASKKKFLIEQIQEALGKNKDVQVVILYGSIINGKFLQTSDIDIAIAGKKCFSVHQLLKISENLRKLTGREIDLVDLRTTRGAIIPEILKKGEIIVKKDSNIWYEVLRAIVYDEEDFQKPLRRIMTQRRRRAFQL